MTRKVYYIDVGNMTKEEAARVVGFEYTPWYKDLFFWSLVIIFSLPSFMTTFILLAGL